MGEVRILKTRSTLQPVFLLKISLDLKQIQVPHSSCLVLQLPVFGLEFTAQDMQMKMIDSVERWHMESKSRSSPVSIRGRSKEKVRHTEEQELSFWTGRVLDVGRGRGKSRGLTLRSPGHGRVMLTTRLLSCAFAAVDPGARPSEFSHCRYAPQGQLGYGCLRPG